MTSGLAAVVQGLAALAGRGIAAGAISVWARRTRVFTPGAHALANDSTGDPLARPLRHGCGSVQIAVWLDDAGRLQLGATCYDTDPGNTVDRLVLRPLEARVARVGNQVHAGQRGPFTLMIEIMETEPDRQVSAYQVLDQQLRRYPELLTRCADGIVVIGPVIVVLTGAAVPRHFLASQPDRFAFCDGSFGDVDACGSPASLVPVVSEHWSWRFGWDGRDEMPVEERHLLRGLVTAAQGEGRRVRIFGIPERSARVREAYWRECVLAGVDLVSAHRLGPLTRFLRGRGAKLRIAVPADRTSTLRGRALRGRALRGRARPTRDALTR